MLIRIVAEIVDAIVMAIILIIPMVLLLIMSVPLITSGSSGSAAVYGQALGMSVILVIIGIVISWLYNAGFESSHYMGTPGKILCGIMVTDLNGQRISFVRATIRYFFKNAVTTLLSAFVSGCLSFIYEIADILAILTNEKKQSIHDMVASTYVVYR